MGGDWFVACVAPHDREGPHQRVGPWLTFLDNSGFEGSILTMNYRQKNIPPIVVWASPALLAVSVYLAAFAGISATGAAGADCPNEVIRVQQESTALPDCRAYEMVSPKGSVPLQGVSSLSGQRFGYSSYYPYEGSQSGGLYLLSTRGHSGWSTQNTTPPQGGLKLSDAIACIPEVLYLGELTDSLLLDGWHEEASRIKEGNEACEGDYPPLVGGEPRGIQNLFLRNSETGSYQLVDITPEGVSGANAEVRDATPDLSHVVFTENAPLTPGAPQGSVNLYEWSEGEVDLVSFLPNGLAVDGALAGQESNSSIFTHAVSNNGERVFFYTAGNLYARVNAMQEPGAIVNGKCSETGKACTVEVDAAVPGAVNLGGAGRFVDASEDGSRVFFMDERKLTPGATATTGKPDLYEYDVETGSLTDLTATQSEPADVLGYAGASEDGSYVYFTAAGILGDGQANRQGLKAEAGQSNLYVVHDGAIEFVVPLNEPEKTRVSPNGQFLVFSSADSLTGYDNEREGCQVSQSGGSCREEEIFVYSMSTGLLSCVSCGVNGARPTAPAEISSVTKPFFVGGPQTLNREVNDAGQIFFETADALLPRATNGAVNVYEYEDGQLSLISSGSANGDSQFLDASASGNDVFFATGQALVQADTDNTDSVYDARVNGGFLATPGESEGSGSCESAEACKPPPGEAPAEPFAASGALVAAENLVEPPQSAGPSAKPPASTRRLTQAEELAKALKLCARRPRREQRRCRAQAHGRFGDRRRAKHKQRSAR